MTARREGPDARDIAQALGGRAEALCREILPHGRRDGPEWRVGSVAGEQGESLGVHLVGQRAGVWADFGASDQRGDALDLVAAVLFRGDKRAAIAWAKRWLGFGDGPVPAEHRAPPPAVSAQADAEDATERRRAALKIYLAARPSIAGTPVMDYLAARGLDLVHLGRQPRALRFHPDLWCAEVNAHLPAMVAAITADGRGHIATHRTWLAQRAGRWTKAPLANPKKSFGDFAGGMIPLWRGASGKPLSEAPAGDHIVIAEGIETGLSIALACPELRVVSAVALGNMSLLALPPAVSLVTLAFDNDPDAAPGTPADHPEARAAAQRARARAKAVARYASEGRAVRIAMPEVAGADWNDILLGVEG